MVRPERFELPTFWYVARRSIQLSYERTRKTYSLIVSASAPGVNQVPVWTETAAARLMNRIAPKKSEPVEQHS